MRMLALVGVLLIIGGVIALAYQGITYTKRETIVDIGPVHATVNKDKTIPLPPVIGFVAIAGGVFLVVLGSRTSA